MDSRHVKASNEDFLDTNKKITEKIFDGFIQNLIKSYNNSGTMISANMSVMKRDSLSAGRTLLGVC